MFLWFRKEWAFAAGNRALGRGDLEKARAIFARAVERAPEDAGLALRLAAALEEGGDLTVSEETLKRAALLEPANPSIAVLTGLSYLSGDRFGESLPLFEKVLVKDPTQPVAIAGKAYALLREGDVDTGFPLLLLELENVGFRFQASVLCFAEGALLARAGTAALVESLLLPHGGSSDSRPQSLATRAEAWVVERWRRLWQPATGHMAEGDRLLVAGRYDEAAARFRAAASERATRDEAQLYLGYALLLGGNPKKALAELKDASELSPSALRLKGIAEMVLGRLEAARPSLEEAARDSIDALDHQLLGVKDLIENKPAAARRRFERALSFAPDDWAAERLREYGRVVLSSRNPP